MNRFKTTILETGQSLAKYEEATQLALSEAAQFEADTHRRADDSREPADDLERDSQISFDYHQKRSLNRIHIVDATTLASDGPDAGKVLIVFFDEFGQNVRYAREEADEAVENTALTNAHLDDHACWANANIGELYQRGHPLGPPYSENVGGDS
ncbi:hypothetical protein N7488_008871 [Penicillium malachiteum]|nr:hypothetical protein N7488_008871 [Penicillium malachiteum]